MNGHTPTAQAQAPGFEAIDQLERELRDAISAAWSTWNTLRFGSSSGSSSEPLMARSEPADRFEQVYQNVLEDLQSVRALRDSIASRL